MIAGLCCRSWSNFLQIRLVESTMASWAFRQQWFGFSRLIAVDCESKFYFYIWYSHWSFAYSVSHLAPTLITTLSPSFPWKSFLSRSPVTNFAKLICRFLSSFYLLHQQHLPIESSFFLEIFSSPDFQNAILTWFSFSLTIYFVHFCSPSLFFLTMLAWIIAGAQYIFA